MDRSVREGFVVERLDRQRRDGRHGVPYARDEVALEPAQKALRVAGQRGALPALLTAEQGGLRRAGDNVPRTVKVGRAGDEGVRRQDEQYQPRRGTRPGSSLPSSVQLLAQTL